MSETAPPPGTIRHLCPLECGWQYDRLPPIGLRLPVDPATPISPEVIQRMAGEALRQDVEATEKALREHLDTHTTEQFVRTIQGLRAEIAELRAATATAGPVA